MMKSLVIAVLSVASAAAFAPVSVPKVGNSNTPMCAALVERRTSIVPRYLYSGGNFETQQSILTTVKLNLALQAWMDVRCALTCLTLRSFTLSFVFSFYLEHCDPFECAVYYIDV
jgi:hypothetical protein